ncbi:MAG: electron transfer flavoprotein subunit alpha [Nitrospinae bacterium RIFCSPLOWO2_02_39_17]|nr:MAG: electron transfer flavoprotein subunit alpha [Nitrospinae bacterium RIFCSPLOWO2_02_39_17]
MPNPHNVAVVAEQFHGSLQQITSELIGAARFLSEKLGTGVSCFLLGHEITQLAERLVHQGADEVIVIDAPQLKEYATLTYRRAVIGILEHLGTPPQIVLMGSTTIGRDLAPRIAAYLETGLTADCTEFDIGDYEHKGKADPSKTGNFKNILYAIRPSFGESLKARILGPWKNPQMATARIGVVQALPLDTSRKGKIYNISVNFKQEDLRIKVLKTVRDVSVSVNLTEAKVIVSGGYGLGEPEGFEVVRDLASVFKNSVVGASRRAVDSSWIGYAHQVGQTGKTVRPDIYIALGISGAIQHRVGMANSKLIIAVNKDADAPILKFAHYGIVGDLYQVAPLLKKALIKMGKEKVQ